MPRDTAGALDASSPLSHHLSVLKVLRRRANKEKRKTRRLTERRIQLAEFLLSEIINEMDVVAEGAIVMHHEVFHDDGRCMRYSWSEPGVFLLVRLTRDRFRRLCEFGAELEDVEPECEDEGAQCEGEGESAIQDNEPSLGSEDAKIDQTHWSRPAGAWVVPDGEAEGEDEPSLGSPKGIVNQERWHDGDRRAMLDDRERDACDDEPDAENGPSLGVTEAISAGDQRRWIEGDWFDGECEPEAEPDEPAARLPALADATP